MIRSIRLVNWRSHADSLLEFRKGTNLLVGIMGAGKSSILEGISFALFGTFPALERRRLKLDNVVRLNEGSARVVLEFDWGDSSYRVEREIERSKKGTSSRSEIYKGGVLAENGPIAVNSYIAQLTGMDYDLFTRAIYSEQNNIDHFLNLDPKRRKEELDRLLGLDRFETARANIVSVINRVSSKRRDLAERFSKEKLEQLIGKQKEQSATIASTSERLSSISHQGGVLTARYKTLSSNYESLKKEKDIHEKLVIDEAGLRSLHESLMRQIAGRELDPAHLLKLESNLAALNAERSLLNDRMRSADERHSALSKESGSVDARMKAVSESRKRLSELEAERNRILDGRSEDRLRAEQKDAESLLLSYESERKSLEKEAAEVSESVALLRPGLSQCPLCSAALTDSGISHVRTEKENLLRRNSGRSKELSGLIIAKKKEHETLMAQASRLSAISERSATLSADIKAAGDVQLRKSQIDSEIAKLAQEKKDHSEKAEKAAAEAERARAELTEAKNLSARKKEASEAEKRLIAVRSAISSSGFDAAAFEGSRTGLENARLEIEKLSSARREAEMHLRLSKDLLKAVDDEAALLKSMEKDAADLSALEEQLSIYRNALSETQISLRSSLTEAINGAMNEIWAIFYPYRNYHGLRLFVNEKDYVFEVNDGTGWRGLETIASGGERASAALALRVALAMVLTPKLSWLILDEPTHNLDSEAVELLSSALQFKVPEVVKQTFVITHDEAFMGSDFASSYRLVRDKNRNGETKIEPM
ncbi:MAG: SMC family ATPase [Candidatus Micrarchaeia archaeon]